MIEYTLLRNDGEIVCAKAYLNTKSIENTIIGLFPQLAYDWNTSPQNNEILRRIYWEIFDFSNGFIQDKEYSPFDFIKARTIQAAGNSVSMKLQFGILTINRTEAP